MLATDMAKTDSFFIRGKVTQTGSSFTQSTEDLGAFVDALGKSVLRIHNIEWMVTDDSEPSAGPSIAANNTLNVGVQLTTQSQTGLVTLDDKSVIASARWVYSRGTNAYSSIDFTNDVAPQAWEKGYLVAVEQLYLGTAADASSAGGDYTISYVMECTVETLSEKAAMALALSQQ
tara:strand:- start:525 stop:1049 length:525 start_codon:yes stop_codon:yes gene_type:complete